MGLEPKVWEPPLWFTLRTMAYMYPKTPNEVTRKKYYEFIANLPVFLPESPVGPDFAALIERFPPSPYLESQGKFKQWLHFIYCRSLEQRGELPPSYTEFMNEYEEKYLTPIEIKKDKSVWRRYIVTGGLLFTFVTLGVIMYRR